MTGVQTCALPISLTNTMLNEFVEKILVHERARKGSQDTTQEIEIYFNFLGRYIPPSLQPVPLTPEEQDDNRALHTDADIAFQERLTGSGRSFSRE